MAVRFLCPNCTARIGARDGLLSERIECPKCSSTLFVPDPTQPDTQKRGDYWLAEEAPLGFQDSGGREDVEMDMTPMVDVTFLLLIFFMVTAAFSLQKSFEVPTPQEDRPSTEVITLDDFQEDPEFVVVRIDENSTFYISAAHWPEEREAPSLQDLFVALTDARRGDGTTIPTRLLVVAHGNARHEQVVAAMDAGTDVGMNDIKMVTVEDET